MEGFKVALFTVLGHFLTSIKVINFSKKNPLTLKTADLICLFDKACAQRNPLPLCHKEFGSLCIFWTVVCWAREVIPLEALDVRRFQLRGSRLPIVLNTFQEQQVIFLFNSLRLNAPAYWNRALRFSQYKFLRICQTAFNSTHPSPPSTWQLLDSILGHKHPNTHGLSSTEQRESIMTIIS